jgi:site-specific recombinase XerD
MANDIVTEPIQQATPETKPAEKKRRKKIPGIYQRGNRWQIDTFYKGIRLRETCATPEMADSVLRKLKTLIDEGRYLDRKRESQETMGQLAERYVAFCEGKRQKSLRSKKTNVERILDHFGREMLVCRVEVADVEAFQTALSATTASRKEANLKPASTNRRLACLRHMLSKAVEWKVLADNPCRGVKQLKENNRRLRYLTVEECRALLDACPSKTLNQLVELALNTGMRKSELLHLERDHVNLRQGFLEILDQKNGEYDTIPLNERALEILRSIPRRLDSKYVFPGKTPDKPFYDLKRQFEKATSKANLQGVTFHILRHTAASHLVMAGVDLATVREILRHKSIEMTLRYAHLSGDHKKAAVDALQNALAGGAKKDAKTA